MQGLLFPGWGWTGFGGLIGIFSVSMTHRHRGLFFLCHSLPFTFSFPSPSYQAQKITLLYFLEEVMTKKKSRIYSWHGRICVIYGKENVSLSACHRRLLPQQTHFMNDEIHSRTRKRLEAPCVYSRSNSPPPFPFACVTDRHKKSAVYCALLLLQPRRHVALLMWQWIWDGVKPCAASRGWLSKSLMKERRNGYTTEA